MGDIQCQALIISKTSGNFRRCKNTVNMDSQNERTINEEIIYVCNKHKTSTLRGYINNEDQPVYFATVGRTSVEGETQEIIKSEPSEQVVPGTPSPALQGITIQRSPSPRAARRLLEAREAAVQIEDQLNEQSSVNREMTSFNEYYSKNKPGTAEPTEMWATNIFKPVDSRLSYFIREHIDNELMPELLDYAQAKEAELLALPARFNTQRAYAQLSEFAQAQESNIPFPPSLEPPTEEELRGKYRRPVLDPNSPQGLKQQLMITRQNLRAKIKQNDEQGKSSVLELREIKKIDDFLKKLERVISGVEPPELVNIPVPQSPFFERGTSLQSPQAMSMIQEKLSSLPVPFQKQFETLFFNLNQFIAQSVRNKVFIDTNYIFGEIKAKTGDFFTFELTQGFLMPILQKMQFYNEGRMLGYNPVEIQFPIIAPKKSDILYKPPVPNALPGTNNEIIFENIPDGGVYSQFMGKYGNIKHPEFPLVELKFNKNVVSGKFVCTQKVDGKEKSRKFDDVNQAKGWAIRGGFYADDIEKLRQSAIQGRYDRKLRVIPVLVK